MRYQQAVVYCCKVLLVVVLLFLIVRNTDLKKAWTLMSGISPFVWLFWTIIGFIGQTLVGNWRWKSYLSLAYGISVPYRTLLKDYWAGMFLGYFVPAGLGWDAYRISRIQRLIPGVMKHVSIVFLEKIIGLLLCLVLPLLTWPWIRPLFSVSNPRIEEIVNYLYYGGIACAFVFSLLFFFRKTARQILLFGERKIAQIAKRFKKEKAGENQLETSPSGDMERAIRTGFYSYSAIIIWGQTFLIRFLSAVYAYGMLYALGTSVPFLLVLFVYCIIGISLMLPISFGGLGVREGVFILVFGAFGVPSEVSLALCCFGLLSVLTNVALGGIALLIPSPIDVPRGF